MQMKIIILFIVKNNDLIGFNQDCGITGFGHTGKNIWERHTKIIASDIRIP